MSDEQNMTPDFESLGFGESLLKAISESGYTTPTPIQAQAIPIVLRAQDVIGIAQTGTGKTASFTLPMIEILSGGRARTRMPRSLVLEPTRELATQVAENFDKYSKYAPLSKALLVGGESMGEQLKLLERGVDVLIATPGRLLDLFERGAILLNDIKVLVIDEADRMLDMGFIPDIERIISLLPGNRQTLLFSATMPPEIRRLSQKFLSHAREISVAAPASTAVNVTQYRLDLPARDKNKALFSLLTRDGVKNAFVFCNRKRDIGTIHQFLKTKGLKAEPLHGDMVQAKRNETLSAFKSGDVKFLICSDVAARGIDVQGVSHVVNYDVPFNADDYVHRIGRTGRAGATGEAWTLVTPEEDKTIAAVEALIQKPVPQGKLPELKTTTERANKPTEKTSAPRGEKTERTAPRHENKKPRRNDEVEETVIGFGDDLPAFLRR